MPDNNTSETNFNFAEQVRQDRIVDLMKIEEQINLKNGTYDPSPEAYQERKKELNHYTSPALFEMIEDTKQILNDIKLGEAAENTAKLHKRGILSRFRSDSARER